MTPHAQLQMQFHVNRITSCRRQLLLTTDANEAARLQHRIRESEAFINRMDREAEAANPNRKAFA